MKIEDYDFQMMAMSISDLPEEGQDIMMWMLKNIKMINELAALLPITMEQAKELYETAVEKQNYILLVLAKTKILREEMKANN